MNNGTMDDNIKRLFHDAQVEPSLTPPHSDVLWIHPAGSTPIGFWKDRLSEKEQALLVLLYKEYQHLPQPTSTSDRLWTEWLLHDSTVPPINKDVQFIHLFLDETIDDYPSFSETLHAAIPQTESLVWIDEQYAVLVLLVEDYFDPVDYEGFVEAIATDFYIDLYLMIGLKTEVSQTKAAFEWQRKAFYHLKKNQTKKHVYHEHELIPLDLMRTISKEETTPLIYRLIGEDLSKDKELLTSISTFFDHNLNTTQAAKALHMHRNSLQYRIDKFVERTGLDIKHFPQAALVYLLIMLHNESS